MFLLNYTTKVEQGHFPDNTLSLQLPTPSTPNMTVFPALPNTLTITWRYENDAELFTLICIKRHYEKEYTKIYLDLPYCPHARMDRVQNKTDVFTLKYFCEVINSLKFDRVYTYDLHSSVSAALLDNIYQLSPVIEIGNAINKYFHDEEIVLFFPDEGAMKRYAKMLANAVFPVTKDGKITAPLKFSYAFGIKNRNWETGHIQSLKVENGEIVRGKRVLIIDDICSRGGTFYFSAKALKDLGATDVGLYITHCENSIMKGQLPESDLISHIYTTHSILHDGDTTELVEYVDIPRYNKKDAL